MDIFENVKMNVGMRQVAEDYGVRVNRNNRALCPFHDDHDPSMLVKDDHYHCFACGAHGDVISFVADLTGLRPYDAARQLARQYGLENTKSPPYEIQMKQRKKTEAQKFRVREQLCFLSLSDYHRCLIEWRKRFVPATADEEWDPRFIESCQQLDSVEYVLDLLLSETEEKRKVIVDELFQSGMIDRLQERMKQLDKEEKDG